jgi:hypothetical protein
MRFLFGHRQVKPRIFEPAIEPLEILQPLFDFVLLFERGLRYFGLIPEIGLGRLLEQFVLARGQPGKVKDASRVFPRDLRGR